MKKQRYDRMLITDAMLEERPDGFLTVDVPITRPGVFPYQRNDGTIQMEAKLPEEIFSDLTITSARAKPITDQHPPEPVTLENINRYSRGMSHTDSRVENGMLKVSVTITDQALIERVKSGDQREISIGFLSDVIEEPGAYKGDAYQYTQRNIDINHIAVVERGRAGSQVSIRADSDAWQIDDTDQQKGGNKMAKYKIDGQEFEVPSEVKSHLEAQVAKLETAATKTKDVDALQGRYDALEAKLQAKETELEEAKKKELSADELDKQVEARVALISGAKTMLGDSFEFTGKTEREIKEAVIVKAKPDFKADGKSDEYVNAFYDATVERSTTEGFSSTGSNHLFSGDSRAADSQKITELKNKRMNMNAQ